VQLVRHAALVDWQAKPGDQPLRTVLTRSDPVPGADRRDAQIDALRLAGSRLAGPEQGHGAVRWHRVTEPRSKVSLPFLTRALSLAALRRINGSLERQFQRQISTALFNTARHDGEANYDNKAFVAGTQYFAVVQSVSSYSGGAHGKFAFFAATFDLKNGQPVEIGRRCHIHPFVRQGEKTAGLSLMEQARAQRQTAFFSDQKTSYGDQGLACWGKETGFVNGGNRNNESDPGGMTEASKKFSSESTRWTMFPTAEGLAIAYGGLPESMRSCRANYRVIPWPQAALARRLPTEIGDQSVARPSASAGPVDASCPR